MFFNPLHPELHNILTKKMEKSKKMGPPQLPVRKKSFIRRKISEIKNRVESELRTNLTKTKSCNDIRGHRDLSSKWSSSLQSLNENAVLSNSCQTIESAGVEIRTKPGRKITPHYTYDQFGGRVLTRTQSFVLVSIFEPLIWVP